MGNGEKTRIAGRYELVRELGRGGCAAVYEAIDREENRVVAVKVARSSMKELVCERMLREARVGATLKHQNLCAVSDWGVLGDGRAYLVMERLFGETLRSALRRWGRLPARTAIGFARQILSALHEAHVHGLVHRDVKPENLFLVQEDGGAVHVKLLDFGVCSQPSNADAALTVAGTIVGTPGYMAPEQLLGMPADVRADVFAVGAVLFEMLTGRRAISREDVEATSFSLFRPIRGPRQICPDLPRSLEATILRALARVPDDRFDTVAELDEALLELASERRVRCHTPTAGVHVPSWEAPTRRMTIRHVA